MRIPSTNVTGTAGGVMFPALSLIQADIESVKRAYLRSTRLIATLTFPAMMGMLVLAEPLILWLVGEKWRASIKLLQLLCVAGLAQSVYNTAAWLYLSRGRPELLLRASIYALLARAAGVLIGIRWGILGIVYGYVVGVYACVLYTTWAPAGRLVGIRVRDLLRNVTGPFVCAAGMAVVVALIDRGLRTAQPSWVRVAIGATAGVAVYVSLVRFVWNTGWDEMRQLLRDIFRPRERSEERAVVVASR
jgi:PST family polysaccharide transporter